MLPCEGDDIADSLHRLLFGVHLDRADDAALSKHQRRPVIAELSHVNAQPQRTLSINAGAARRLLSVLK